MATPTLGRFLGRSPELAALKAHAARLEKLQQLYQDTVPAHLAESSRVANYKLETLVIHAANAPVAVKLKQLAPRLKTELLRAGIPVADIQFKVQPIRPKAPLRKPDRDATVSENARTELKELGERLEADSPLRAALRRFLDRAG